MIWENITGLALWYSPFLYVQTVINHKKGHRMEP